MEERGKAALKFFIYTFSASAFLLVGVLYLGFSHQHQTGGALTFAYGVLASTSMSHATALWLFVAFAIAFGAKAPIWPLHTWSPLTYAEAPTAGSIELSALLAKLGSYGLLRFAVGLFPLALADARPVVLTLAVIGILYGSLLACVAKDLKRFVAYSSLAQMGFITLGVVSGSQIATVGAVLLMFNHGIITIGFFLIIGFIEQRRGSYQVADLQGLQGPAPVMAGVFTVVMLASIGLPGLSGFVSEYLILIGTFAVHAWWGVVGAFASWRRRCICCGPTNACSKVALPGERDDPGRLDQGTLGPRADRGLDRGPGRISPAGTRSHHALGASTD